MAQKPLKKVKIQKKPTKYFKAGKKRKDEEALIRKHINKHTVERLEKEHGWRLR
ncbi:hypothetical protein PAEPH01_0779 [Pancytospora epiphaga]|nr:hypothetical protein PAEPH01_0779 [Pancytospora epiphaga]